MNRIIKRVGILFVIFAAALLLFFFAGRNLNRKAESAYVDMGEASLPVVTVEMFGRDMNRMPGYRQEMGNDVAGDSLTLLPEDRALAVKIRGGAVNAISYEIRSMDRERLVESTRVDERVQTEDGIRIVLPIQNLLTKGKEYLLRLQLDTKQHGVVYYYTRILWADGAAAQSMVDLAVDFSARTFDYEQARELVTYLETSATEDNSSFGHTSIRSSFSQLTWGKLKMQPMGEVQVRLKELDGIMCCVQLSYMASREGEKGTEIYEVEENFTMKWNETRTYMMDYEREVDQVFQGERSDFVGKRIMLGITNDDKVEAVQSPKGEVIAYRTNRDLWSYMQGERQAVRVFSFRDRNMNDVRNNYGEHDIRILAVEDTGDIDFMVFGYMNRGNHEGQMGIAGYRYRANENALEELYYIPYYGSFEALEDDLTRFTCQTGAGMLYLYVDHAVYGIDLKSRESMVIADALEEGAFAVSSDKRLIAWQEGGKRYDSKTVNLMNLETGENQALTGAPDECVRTLGFVGRDFVYGVAREEDAWIINGRVEELPMRSVKIINDRMEEETSYEKDGYYISGVQVEGSRIHLSRATKISEHQYAGAQDDTIVCNADMGLGRLDGIGWYASQDKGKLYFVQLGQEVRSSWEVRAAAPKRVSFEESNVLELKSNFQVQGMKFYAYGGGHLQKITMDFTEALQAAYGKMGFVTDENRRILWNRVNRGNRKVIRDPAVAFAPVGRHLDEFTASRSFGDGVVMFDGRGCSMMQMLYFIDQGIPVLGYVGEGQYLLLCGYDQYNVMLYDPSTGETHKSGLNDTTEYFRVRGNDFICAVRLR